MRRLGKFNLTEDADVMRLVYDRVLPYRVEFLFHSRSFSVIAECNEFDEITEGEEVPDYQLVVRRQQQTDITGLPTDECTISIGFSRYGRP